MIYITIPPSSIDYAKRKLKSISINKDVGVKYLSKFGSEKKRILTGYVGEKIIMDYLGIKKDSDDYDFDLISKKGKRLEIKTISCKFKPKKDYFCTVNSHDLNGVHKQDADYYIFLRILNNYSSGWILGWITCDEFFKKGQFVNKGTDFGPFRFIKANATILPISSLNQFT